MPVKPTSRPIRWPGAPGNIPYADWPFFEGYGSNSYEVAGQYAGGGIDGALTNIVWNPGPAGYSLGFNGSSSYVKLATTLGNVAAPITLSMRVYQNNLKNGSGNGAVANMLFNSNTGGSSIFNEFSIDNGTLVYVKTGGIWTSTGITIAAKVWTHLSFVLKSASALDIYVDGVLRNQITDNLYGGKLFPLFLGAWTNNSTTDTPGFGFLDGDIDYFRIHQRALSAGEIAEIAFDPFLYYRPKTRISDVSILILKILAADAGSYVVTGSTATLTKGKRLSADPGSFLVTGSNASLTLSTPGGGSTQSAVTVIA